ncbi:MAG: tetratricopeptide repeat protein [Candidatus Latescibacterota bacterium]
MSRRDPRPASGAVEGAGSAATARLLRHAWVPIALACALVWANSLGNGFHYDDEHSLLLNPHIRDLGNLPRFLADPSMFSAHADKAMFRPLLLATYAVNYRLGGYEVWGYHAFNLLLHAANAGLVWRLAGLLGCGPGTALVAGLLFAVHPVASEPVNYVCSRSESLASCFYLLGLVAFLRGRRQRGPTRWTGVACAALVLGLLSKDTVITLPAVLLLADLLASRGGVPSVGLAGLARRHGWYWGIAAVYLAVVWANGFLGGSLGKLVRPLDQQLWTQAKALVYYAGLLAWPVPLNVEHQFAAARGAGEAAVLAALAVLGSAALLLGRRWLHRRAPVPAFLLGWALLALLPVLVMPLNVLVNERRLYLPAAAWCIGLAAALRALPGAWRSTAGGLSGVQGPAAPLHRRWGVAVTVALLAGYAALGWARSAEWRDDRALWGSAARRAPLMPRVHLYLGNAHKDAARNAARPAQVQAHWDTAAQEYRRTTELDPHGELGLRALGNLGSVHFSLAQDEEDSTRRARHLEAAEEAYRRAVEASPRYADALVNLGSISCEWARQSADPSPRHALLQQAVEWYGRALEVEPNHAAAWLNLGLAYFGLGDRTRAQQAYERSYHLNPYDPSLLSNMGMLLLAQAREQTGGARRARLERARAFFVESLRLSPGYSSPVDGLRQVDALLQGAP